MIVHIDSDNPKSIEQKVQELILKKLYIKVEDEKIFINKQEFIALILRDIISLAKADFSIDKALKIALEEQKEYQSIPVTKRMELEEASVEFQVEVEAYQTYLNVLRYKIPDDDICMDVLFILNSETELLEKKLHDLMMDSLSLKISEEDAVNLNVDRIVLLENYANYVKLIASNDSIEDAAEEIYQKNKQNNINKKFIKEELGKFAPALKDEINAYKIALSMEEQNAEFPAILSMVKQLLQIED